MLRVALPAGSPTITEPRWRVAARTVYVGGPIDLSKDDPDLRHHEVAVELAKAGVAAAIFCPFCDQQKTQLDPSARIERNRSHYMDADFVVFVWHIGTQVSLGSAVELWERASGVLSAPQVVGTPVDGLFVRYLGERGVGWWDSVAEWAWWVKERTMETQESAS